MAGADERERPETPDPDRGSVEDRPAAGGTDRPPRPAEAEPSSAQDLDLPDQGPGRASDRRGAAARWAAGPPEPPAPVQAARRRRWGRWVLGAVVGFVAVAAAGAIWLAWRVWSALPATAGRVTVTGVAAPVEILRDIDGVPHIRGTTEEDVLFALGFAHAQDRLWQMEFQRRLGHGRLAEILGPAALPSDRVFRTVGLSRRAADSWAKAEPVSKARLEAYARGVNAHLTGRHGRRLPAEFAILGVDPEPWRPEDSLVWMGVLAWELSTNWRDELLRARVGARVGEEGAAVLMPPSTDGLPAILPEGVGPLALGGGSAHDRTWLAARASLDALADTARAARGLAVDAHGLAASNNWVVSSTRSASGKPLLANDPHLGAQVPALWYLAHLQGGRLDAIGATLPGVPGVIIGHNARIAWGMTNVMTDNQDLFIERLDSRDHALHRGQWQPMTVVRETIHVKGAPSETLVVRVTRHGPLMTDLVPNAREALALAWTWLSSDDRVVDTWFDLNVAGSWDEFTAALARHRAPMQNFVYADVDGNIGYYAPGAIPLRPLADGTLPMPGWTGEHDWAGDVPSHQWPQVVNPTRGYVASANNPVFAGDAPYTLSTNWEPGYRAARIVEMIESAPSLSVDDMARMQADVRSAQVRVVLPWLRRAAVRDEEGRGALELLRAWDGSLAPDSAAAALYKAWTTRAAHRLFADELGDALWADYARPPHWLPKALHRVVLGNLDAWCDDVRTPAREGCEDMLGLALSDALSDLRARQGTGDPAAWRWDRDNVVTFPHLPLHVARTLRPMFSRSTPMGGDSVTVNPVMRSGDRLIVASYRQIIDLADLDRSLFVTTTGQSGQVLSGRYDNLIERWRKGEYLPMRFTRETVNAAIAARLVLEPR
jgi:penicillin amidase